MTHRHWVLVSLAFGFAMAIGVKAVERWPDIAVAWGNAFAERERRLAEEARRYAEATPQREAAEREAALRFAADATYNEANCKVTIAKPFGSEVLTGIRRIRRRTDGYYVLYYGGDVERLVGNILKTENCR